jgi:hypothetical protein
MVIHDDDDALQVLLKEDLQQIKKELLNAHLDDFAKTVYSVLAENPRSNSEGRQGRKQRDC